MRITFKVIPVDTKNTWVGWFGDQLIKVRIQKNDKSLYENLISYLKQDLGIRDNSIAILGINEQRRMYTIELPDTSWELFLTAIEK